MNIAIFNEITTEDLLVELEVEAKKYDGLYVDMENAPERKYVKDKASHILSLLKQLDRARIDKSKSYKVQVEAEAEKIKDRLVTANVPFQALIDEHKAERARILALKKASDEAKAAALQLPIDHEEALQLNELFDFKAAQSKVEQEARDQEIRDEAVKSAKENELRLIEQSKQDAIDAKSREELAVEKAKQDAINQQLAKEKQTEFERLQREANKEHLKAVNNSILSALMTNGVDEESAKTMIRLAAKGELPYIKINY